MRVFIDCVYDKRDLCANLSSDCHMPVPHTFPLNTALAQKVEDQNIGRICVDKSHHTCSLKTAVEERRVERRCDEISCWNESCCCDACRIVFSLEQVFHESITGSDAGERGLGSKGVPAGRPVAQRNERTHKRPGIQQQRQQTTTTKQRRSSRGFRS